MIERLLVCRSRSFDPYENLALEEALLNRVGEGELILYLWRNERTVVIGRNQNPWKECRTALLAEEGGRLARRLSGGGAVFHDLGNLNFTFLMREADYDLPRQLTVIERACQSLGIPAERSGRNDLLADGRKFSGNAFYKHNGKAYHHGTLMLDVDLEMVQRYLSPSKAKLAAKGVDSVRSRVVNLHEFVPELSVDRLSDALIAALAEVYAVGAAIGRPPEAETFRVCHSERSEESVPPSSVLPLDVNELDLRTLTEKYRSDAWLYGQKLPFTLSVEERFPWGGVELQLNVNEGVIQGAKVYTDAMDETLAPRLEAALTGVPLRPEALRDRLADLCLPAEREKDMLSLLATAL
ncbi:MAG: lipoate--protein ligase [Oscillospiraceae bacterium]|nr:lipoate--protein ligase [Oscillospiraceae bacterium]